MEEQGADLMSLGDHCSVSHCRQRDFLPFKCSGCQQVFCLEHRLQAAHSCRAAEQGDKSTTAICPLCARLLRFEPGQDPNVIFDRHTAEGCDPANYAKVMKKPKCPVKGCKERLNLVNTHTCKHCNTAVCMSHRFPDDHSCQGNPKNGPHKDASHPLLSRLLGIGSTQSATQSQRGGATAQRSRAAMQAAAQASRPAAQAHTGGGGGGGQATSQSSRSQQASGGMAGGSGREECPVCTRTFGSLAALIAHSREHDPETAEDMCPCPHCRKMFPAVMLVEHVEKEHSSSTGCVVC